VSRVYTDTIEPRKPTQDITLGITGQTVTLPGNDLRVNTVKDKGGNTLWTSDGSGTLSSVNSALKGNLVLLSTQTVSNSASVSFTSGIDSTYDVYIFKFSDINPATDLANFTFQVNATDSTGYDRTMTTTCFQAYHNEADNAAALAYNPGHDQGQGTAFQVLAGTIGNDADDAAAGELHLFAPSSTTYVKQFYATTALFNGDSTRINNTFVAGYINDTTAIDDIQFKMSSGNMDGTIKMYGLL
jgi:hypothetical protein